MFSPGVRVGWGIMPKDLVGPITELKGNIDFGSPNLAQHVMHEILAGELIQPHIESLRKSYNAKRLAMLVAVQQHLGPLPGVSWLTPRGGMYVWLTLPEGVDTGLEGELFPSVQEAGVLYVPGHYCYPTEGPTGHNTIRLSFGDQSIEKIRIGIAALAEGIGRLL
jgi:2-aminoadipate transaminase